MLEAPTMAAVLAEVNRGAPSPWALGDRFDRGALGGAWQLHRRGTDAVLKVHRAGGDLAPNPDAPAIVEHLRAAGYPTPAYLAWGTTGQGIAWTVQELARGEPLTGLDRTNAGIFVDLAELHRLLRIPTQRRWNPFIAERVREGHPSHAVLGAGGPRARRLLDACLALAAPHDPTVLEPDELVHSDLGIDNVLVADGALTAVIDIDGAGRGCAGYDLLAPAVAGVSWASDPVAIARLVAAARSTYDDGAVSILAACLTIEQATWYARVDPAHSEQRAERHLRWIADLDPSA